MAIPVEGYCVIAPQERIRHLLESNVIKIPNATALGDDHIWRCCFMAQDDALEFIETLESLGLNVSQGPDPDVVLVDEFDQSVNPYCEWLQLAKWEKAIIAWKAGTKPESIVAREGWDPKVGSGLVSQKRDEMDHLEFLRLDGNVEVYLNKETGQELYIGRTSTPYEALFKSAAQTITKNFVTAGQNPLSGQSADEVAEAVEMLEQILEKYPDAWNVLFFHGKGQLALGNHERAYQSLRQAFEVEQQVESIPRELAGVCLELGKFDEAVRVAEKAVALDPDNAELIGNLALAHLLAGRLDEAAKSIAAAIRINADDRINNNLRQAIEEVKSGTRPQPHSLADLQAKPRQRKKKFWEFWKK